VNPGQQTVWTRHPGAAGNIGSKGLDWLDTAAVVALVIVAAAMLLRGRARHTLGVINRAVEERPLHVMAAFFGTVLLLLILLRLAPGGCQ
jgi:uncharacterized membrane protein YecN with MAPEG domain